MGAAYLDSLDIANRALQHVGVSAQYRINSVDEDSKANAEVSQVYDKLRRAELQRNIWTFATRKVILRPLDVGVMFLDPAYWSETAVYFLGAVVRDVNGGYWFSNGANNVGQEPGRSEAWEPYFGPLTVSPWREGESYYAGDLVYRPIQVVGTEATATVFAIYMSRHTGNSDAPDVSTPWSATAQYAKGHCVSYSGTMWYSLLEYNINNPPAQPPADYSSIVPYNLGAEAVGPDGFIYASNSAGNTGNDPATSPSYWTNTGRLAAWSAQPAQFAASAYWTPLYAGLKSFNAVYPLGTGPASGLDSRNVYRLPAGYLRAAPLDPKVGRISWLGGPVGNAADDFLYENGFIITMMTGPMLFRFVADVTDVTTFDDMFCEGLACRIAREICEPMTQSTSKINTIGQAYQKFMSEARLIDAIEAGAAEPAEDEYITVRR